MILRFISISFFLLLATAANAQLAGLGTAGDALAAAAAPTVQFRHQPVLPGGAEAFTTFLTQQVAYPEAAREYGIEGTVVVRVAVDERGVATVQGLAKRLFPACDEVALAAAANLPRFLPAVADGKPVARTLHVPFKFSLR